MIVKELKLKNFRNYENETFLFDEKVNIIHGSNAQGKTNILEAIYYFSLGKSQRAKKDAEIIKIGTEQSDITIKFCDEKRENTAEVNIYKNRKKSIKVNDIPVRKNSELVGKFNGVYFGPEYLELIKGAPKIRRKNIDIIISQIKPAYFSALSEMRKILEQKSSLLKSEREDKITLEILNERLTEAAAYVSEKRLEYLKKIEETAAALQKMISSEKERFEIKYISSVGAIEEFSERVFKEKFRKRLSENAEREKFFGECKVGPQRDEIEYRINGLEVKSYASQGQQKTAVLVQKIAEVELFKKEKGEYPVLLLDDIMSELDKTRQEFVIDKIKNMQIFITCTEKDGFEGFKRGKYFEIKGGKLL